MVVQREYGLDILPFSQLRCQRSPTFFSCSREHVVDLSVSFGFGQRLVLEGFTGILVGLDLSDAMQPVLDSGRDLASSVSRYGLEAYLDLKTTSPNTFSSAAFTKTSRELSLPLRTSVCSPTSAKARISFLN